MSFPHRALRPTAQPAGPGSSRPLSSLGHSPGVLSAGAARVQPKPDEGVAVLVGGGCGRDRRATTHVVTKGSQVGWEDGRRAAGTDVPSAEKGSRPVIGHCWLQLDAGEGIPEEERTGLLVWGCREQLCHLGCPLPQGLSAPNGTLRPSLRAQRGGAGKGMETSGRAREAPGL